MNRIPVSQIVNEIREGIGEAELMLKYQLSVKRLMQIMQMLVKEKAIAHAELYENFPTYRTVIDVLASRRSPRWEIPFPMRIYHDATSQKGLIRDISDNGLRVAGINVKVGDVLTLRLPATGPLKNEPIELVAVCRWSKMRGMRKKYLASGFEIVSIAEESRTRLRKLIDLVRVLGRETGRVQHVLVDVPTTLRYGQAARAENVPREFSGRIDGVDILDLVQFLLLIGKKTLLQVRSLEGVEYRLYLDEGRIVHALAESLKGKEAFFACMNLTGTYFETQPWHDPGETTIHELGELMLVEAARNRDESSWANTPEASR